MIKAVIFDMYETLITLFDSPLYFSTEIAADAGIPLTDFQKIWRPAEKNRTIGKITLEKLLETILKTYGCYSEELLARIVEKRMECRRAPFEHLHPEILPLLEKLKDEGVKIGLISNCFSEEAVAIRESVLFPYFDVVCLSYEEGLQKPEPAIFERCIEKLQVRPEECLYVGDGGSSELPAATAAGMQAVQAVWYLRDGTLQPARRMKEYRNIERPMDILEITS